MIPEREDMIGFLRHVDDCAERQGWEVLPPILGVVRWCDDGYRGVPYPTQPWEVVDDGDVSAGLLKIGALTLRNSREHRTSVMGEYLRGAGDSTAGVWFMSYAWIRLEQGAEYFGLVGSGRVSMRTCLVVDCGGRTYQSLRPRGRASAAIGVIEPGDPEAHVCGSAMDGLRRILLGLGLSMSPGTVDMEKLGMVGVRE